jgi:hypothetical protein
MSVPPIAFAPIKKRQQPKKATHGEPEQSGDSILTELQLLESRPHPPAAPDQEREPYEHQDVPKDDSHHRLIANRK